MATSDTRDEFSPSTKEALAKRSGYICAYPNCKRMTIAASDDRQSGFTMTGIAAHITAASENGPRHDPLMSPEERSSASNGIWTCQIHGKFIDDNPSKCTTEELHRWKAQHEKWVFDRVESGIELFNQGIYQVAFSAIGIFSGEHSISLGRHNILAGPNESGKTTFCQIAAAFSGVPHWTEFNTRFKFSNSSSTRTFISATHQNELAKTSIKLSPQLLSPHKPKKTGGLQRMHIELNGSPSADWPRSLFRSLHFESQFRITADAPRDRFVKAIGYLASAFALTEDLVWDCLRDELFATSLFNYRFHRTGRRKVDIQVPDGRSFYLPHGNLSTSEQHIAFVEIALKLILCSSQSEHWLLIFDTGFLGNLDASNKKLLFERLTNLTEKRIQTLFCLSWEADVDELKDVQPDKWVNATRLKDLTLHAFL